MQRDEQTFVLCVENKDCDDLVVRKVYQTIPDPKADREGYIRLFDESGEDYLYPVSYFIPLTLPREARERMAKAG